jgi:flagellar secretion chaperone FliS
MLTEATDLTEVPTEPSEDPAARVSLLLETAARRAREAQALLLANDVDGCGRAIEGALRIVDALHGALDHAHGGELASRLEYLYSYGALRLLQGASQRDPAPMEEAAGIFAGIASAWRELATLRLAIAA